MNNRRLDFGGLALGLALALGGATSSCAPGAPPAPRDSSDVMRLTFESRSAERALGDCIAGAPGCAYIRFDHPNVVAPPIELIEAAQAVTDAIQMFLSQPYRPGEGEEEPAATPRELFERFIDEAGAFAGPEPLYLERKVFVVHGTSRYVSLGFVERSFLGGEHPVETYRFENFALPTGERLSLRDVVIETQQEELRLVAEQAFRETRGLDAEADLPAAGFRFESNRFALTENFALEDEVLSFYYNPSEIAPVELGPTEIRLGYDTLDGLLTPLVRGGR